MRHPFTSPRKLEAKLEQVAPRIRPADLPRFTAGFAASPAEPLVRNPRRGHSAAGAWYSSHGH